MLEVIFQDSKLLHIGQSSSKTKAICLGLEQILRRRRWSGKLTFNKHNKPITKSAQVFRHNYSGKTSKKRSTKDVRTLGVSINEVDLD